MIGVGDQLFQGQRVFSRQETDVGHADDGQTIPAFGAQRSSGTAGADRVRRFTGRQISCEQAIGDDRGALGWDSFVVECEGAETGAVLLARVGNYRYQVASVAQLAQLV